MTSSGRPTPPARRRWSAWFDDVLVRGRALRVGRRRPADSSAAATATRTLAVCGCPGSSRSTRPTAAPPRAPTRGTPASAASTTACGRSSPTPARGHLYVGGEFTKVGGSYVFDGTEWQLVGASTQAYVARFSGTPTTLETLSVAFAGDGSRQGAEQPGRRRLHRRLPGRFRHRHHGHPHRRGRRGLDLHRLVRRLLRARHMPGHDEPIALGHGHLHRRHATAGSGAAASPTHRAATATPTCSRCHPREPTGFGSRRAAPPISTPPGRPTARGSCSRAHRTGDAEIFVMDADGTNRQRLTNTAGADTRPAWSPDGAQIALHLDPHRRRRDLRHGRRRHQRDEPHEQRRRATAPRRGHPTAPRSRSTAVAAARRTCGR